ncbi:MAG: flagellar protein FlaG [Rhodocyclaceae bacterium]|nr:flagellar protein FlaG [Rhodocyclaceae bacterium]
MIAGTQTSEAAAAAGQVAGGQRAGEDAAQQQPGGHQPSEAEIQEAIDEVRRVIEPVARNLQFSVDDDTNLTLIKVVDSATDEVIRQIPSEEMVAIAKAIDKLQGMLQQGVLLRDKA